MTELGAMGIILKYVLEGLMPARIAIDHEKIARFCEKYGIRKLALFGSVLRDDFGPESDVDVLVEFEPERVIGLKVFEIEDELSKLLDNRKVDLISEKYLNQRLKARVLKSAELQYGA
jgi:predicted nucleotidyltransferase